MCITVTDIPKTKKQSIITVVYKWLDNYGIFYKTPFLSTKVDNNGILSTKSDYRPIIGNSYGDGFIHSYDNDHKHRKLYHKAYAINICGYNKRYKEVISKFLYIPQADFSKNKKKRIRTLSNILRLNLNDKKNKPWLKICKLFPEYIDSFKYNQYYLLEKGTSISSDLKYYNGYYIKKKEKNTMNSNGQIQWIKMINNGYISRDNLRDFANGYISGREFESNVPRIRKTLRSVGVNKLRELARRALVRNNLL